MKMSNVATYFNDDAVYDAYTGTFLFYAHSAAHNDKTSAGSVARRRTLVMDPTNTLPPRRVIQIYNDTWVMGGAITDSLSGIEIQSGVTLKKVTGTVTVATPAQAALGTPGAVSMMVHREYYHDTVDGRSTSELDTTWLFYASLNETVLRGAFLTSGADLYRVRSSYASVDDFLVLEADLYESDARQSVIFTGPAALEFTTGATPNTTVTMVIQTDTQKYYLFRNEAETSSKPGDRIAFVAKSAITPVVGGHVRMMGTNWRIITMAAEADSWALRLRPA